MSTKAYLCAVCCTLVSMAASAKECGENALPVAAQKVLSQHFTGWKVVTVSDLTPDDKQIWSETYGDACPGIVEGNFTGKGRRQFGVTLIRRDNSRIRQALVLLNPTDRVYVDKVLLEPSDATIPNVVVKFPPGTYSDAERTRSVRTRFDGIALIQLEASGTLFYKTKDGFSRLVFSD